MKAYGGEKVQLNSFITSVSDQLHAPASLNPKKETPVPIQPFWTFWEHDRGKASPVQA
jgi:hypothetical protein